MLGGGGGGGDGLLALLRAQPALPLDVQTRQGNSPLHVAAFGGAERIATFLAEQGGWVALPNADGLCPLDTAQRTARGTPLASALLRSIRKPPHWVRDRLIGACQLCKAPFAPSVGTGGGLLLQRKHHCRHCGRCVCASCSPRKMAVAKFGAGGAGQAERVCVECEPIVRGGA